MFHLQKRERKREEEKKREKGKHALSTADFLTQQVPHTHTHIEVTVYTYVQLIRKHIAKNH